ncbi:heme-binding domain-containing protein [Nitrosophilus labii]|uniref:heme-binding domain-containing protein n=1 Tax=Nitrosophilus labii TaxID=2706014 RepID=UPI0016574CBD|nr:heme-binding domain-containing protein [Nitrosophilus labii]
MKGFYLYLGVLAAVFLIFQFIPSYKKVNPPVDKSKEIKVPAKVMEIFKRSCYDCHSNETHWPWYADVAPMKWVVRRDVVQGRKALNFSIWQDYDEEKREKLKKSIYRSVNLAMPLPQYLWLHPDAKLSQEDKKIVRDWASDGKGYIKIDIR